MGLVHLHHQVAQDRVVELEGVLELGERLAVALDVHEYVMRLVHLGDGVGHLATAPVLEAVHHTVAGGDQRFVALDHARDLLALVRMDDKDHFVMSHVIFSLRI